ncbi:MAG: nitroreductase [Candidatus Eisenbacteria bacterium]|nr:nitroreductase [Candidatus Eisenbacteria bacterium]
MHVQDALATRLSVRDFLPTPVSGELIREILITAARAPSGGNLQPWHIAVIAGEPLTRLRSLMIDRVAACPEGEPVEYDIYPPSLHSPYRERRFEVGEDMYRLLGIAREDKAARRAWFARNYQFFGAPLALFCSVDRRMGPPQWSDLGMFLQSVMLLLRERGLDSCPQECWSLYHETVGRFIALPPERLLFCGMAIGYRNPDHPVNRLASKRAPLTEFAEFMGV